MTKKIPQRKLLMVIPWSRPCFRLIQNLIFLFAKNISYKMFRLDALAFHIKICVVPRSSPLGDEQGILFVYQHSNPMRATPTRHIELIKKTGNRGRWFFVSLTRLLALSPFSPFACMLYSNPTTSYAAFQSGSSVGVGTPQMYQF